MAFGTGHHETTRQVIRFQLELDHQGKTVLDVGCGTGVLSILAEMKGASGIISIDNDPYAVSNTVDNKVLNSCQKITVKEGTVATLSPETRYDLILANINRNVLLAELPVYKKYLNTSGLLIISGFYTFDLPILVKKIEDTGLHIEKQTAEQQWACLLLKKV
jgi:ribosomal protein L11 methyltransferase